MVAIATFFSLLILAPLAVVFYLSFFEGSLLDTVNRFSLKNYTTVFGELFTYKVLWNTAGFSFVALVVSFFFGIPTAWLVERTDFPGKTVLLTFMTIGLLIPGFAVAMGWLFLLHPRIGVVNQFLQDTFGLIDAPLSITTITGMGWVQGLNLTPVAFIMTAGAFRAMDPKLEEAAEASGASTARMIFTVTIPLIWPGRVGGGDLYFYRRPFRLRRAGDHRLVQPDFHLQHLYVSDGEPAGRAAEIRRQRDLQHHRHHPGGVFRLVVLARAAAQPPI